MMKTKHTLILFLCGLVATVLLMVPAMTDSESPASQPATKAHPQSVQVQLYNESGELYGPVASQYVFKTEDEWRKILKDKEQFEILRKEGTERPFTGELLKNKEAGTYVCAGCKLPLYHSSTKFESGTGWPSFYDKIAPENVTDVADNSYGWNRTEVECTRCGGHLGHVFNDGPEPTGLRHCINSKSLAFVPEAQLSSLAEAAYEPKEEKIVLAAGCFWCVEAVFEHVAGVTNVVSGYAGGTAENADYKKVAAGLTKHAEAVEITYDPDEVSEDYLLDVFFATHDPTTADHQGPDYGPQYRTAIFYANDAEKAAARKKIDALNASKKYDDPIATTLEPLEKFYPAEDYHQDFVRLNPNHPYVKRWVPAKLKKVEKLEKERE